MTASDPRRVLVPALLLVLAACALAGVFAVHHIEAGEGPLAEPYATRFLSPNGDGSHDVATIRFVTHRTEHVTVRVLTVGGHVVRTLVRNRVAHGPTYLTWDARDDHGRLLPDGEYRVLLTRSGDSRQYEPALHTFIDTVPPRGQIHRIRRAGDQLRGLYFAEPFAHLEILDAHGRALAASSFPPQKGSPAASPTVLRPPPGTRTLRFVVAHLHGVDPATLRYVLVDRAGNTTPLRAPAVEHSTVAP